MLGAGTHGGDFHLPGLTEMVRAIHLLGPGGKQDWIEPRRRRITDDLHLRAALPEVTLAVSDELFDAALVSVGSLGVIVAVVVEVVRQFWLEERSNFKSTWPAVAAALPGYLADPNLHFVQVVVHPYDQTAWLAEAGLRTNQ